MSTVKKQQPNVIHHEVPGNTLFPGAGRECPFRNCKCLFSSSYDLEKHMDTHWRPFKNREGEWIFVDDYPELKRELLTNGKLTHHGYFYSLSGGGKFITRRKVGVAF